MNEILIVAQWTTKVTRSQITLAKPSSDWLKLLKGWSRMLKFTLKKWAKKILGHGVWLSVFHCIDGNDAFLWCSREEPVACCELQMQAEHSAAHWDVPIQSHLAVKLAAKFIFNIRKVTVIGICTMFHFNPEEGWNSTKPWHFLQLKQRDLFSPLHCWYWTKEQTDEICFAYMLKVSFQNHQDSVTKQMIKKAPKTKNHQTKTANHKYNINLSEHFLAI